MLDTPFNQNTVFIAEAIAVSLLVVILFRVRTYFGLSPLYVTIGVFQPIQSILASSIYVEIMPNIIVSPGSVIMFPAILTVVLLIYIKEDAIETRKAIYGIMLANLTMAFLLFMFGLQLELAGTINFLNVPKEIFTHSSRLFIVGTSVLFFDILLIISVYELISKVCNFVNFCKKILFLRIYISLFTVLIFDSLLFYTGAFYDQPNYISLLISGIVGKVIMAIFFSAVLSIYLKFFETVEDQTDRFQDTFYALTYRQKYEKKKQESEESKKNLKLFLSIVEASTDGIGVSTPNGVHWYQNEAFTRMFGEIGADPPKTVYCDESLGREVFETLMKGYQWIGEVLMCGSNGNKLNILLSAYPVKDRKGEIECIVGVHTDVTEKKKEWEEKRLLEAKMLHGQKLESLGLLSSSIAHDFNNLLATIMGYTDLALLSVPEESDIASNLKMIKASSKHAEDLTKQMLSYSGKGTLKIELIDLEKLITDMMNLLSVVISKEIRIEYNFVENLPMFNGDVGQINQVIMNIITNAADAIKSTTGTGIITLDTGSLVWVDACIDISDDMPLCFTSDGSSGICDDYKGLCVYFEVTDTGCGMSSEDAKKIFNPFYTTKTTGRGLGMSAVLSILKEHKGILKICSSVGKGTKFSVFFPVDLQKNK